MKFSIHSFVSLLNAYSFNVIKLRFHAVAIRSYICHACIYQFWWFAFKVWLPAPCLEEFCMKSMLLFRRRAWSGPSNRASGENGWFYHVRYLHLNLCPNENEAHVNDREASHWSITFLKFLQRLFFLNLLNLCSFMTENLKHWRKCSSVDYNHRFVEL